MYVPYDEVRRQSVLNPTRLALKKMADSMKELQQGQVLMNDFERALNVRNCVVCQREITPQQDEERDHTCAPCIEEIKRKKAYEEANQRIRDSWQALYDSIRLMTIPKYQWVLNNLERTSTNDIWMKMVLVENPNVYVSLNMRHVYPRGRSASRFNTGKYYLGLDTSSDLSYKGTWDWNTDELAKKVVTKAYSLMDKMEEAAALKRKLQEKALTVKQLSAQAFGIPESDVDEEWAYPPKQQSYKTGAYKFTWDRATIRTHDGKIFYSQYCGQGAGPELLKKFIGNYRALVKSFVEEAEAEKLQNSNLG